jgi:hypothetical protein
VRRENCVLAAPANVLTPSTAPTCRLRYATIGHQARSQFRAFSFPGFASVQDQVRDDARSDQQWHGKRNDDLSISRLGFAQRADFRCDCEVGEIRLPCTRILS